MTRLPVQFECRYSYSVRNSSIRKNLFYRHWPRLLFCVNKQLPYNMCTSRIQPRFNRTRLSSYASARRIITINHPPYTPEKEVAVRRSKISLNCKNKLLRLPNASVICGTSFIPRGVCSEAMVTYI